MSAITAGMSASGLRVPNQNQNPSGTNKASIHAASSDDMSQWGKLSRYSRSPQARPAV
jgi:hypothetical protein